MPDGREDQLLRRVRKGPSRIARTRPGQARAGRGPHRGKARAIQVVRYFRFYGKMRD